MLRPRRMLTSDKRFRIKWTNYQWNQSIILLVINNFFTYSIFLCVQKIEFILAEVDWNTERWSFFPKPLVSHKPKKIPPSDRRIPSSYVAVLLSAQTILGCEGFFLCPRTWMKVRCYSTSPAKMNNLERDNQIGTHQKRSWCLLSVEK